MRRKTNEEFVEEILNKYNNEFIPQEEYKGNKVKISFLHNKCGRIFESSPDNILHRGACSLCGSEQKRQRLIEYNKKERTLTKEEAQNRINKIRGEEYEIIGNYVHSDIPIQIRHKTCGTIFTVNLFNFIRPNRKSLGVACPCERSKRRQVRSLEEFKKEFYNCEQSEEYEIFDETYINYTTKVKLLHKPCGSIYEIVPSEFITKGTRCSHCRTLGEKCYNWQGGISTISHNLRAATASWQKEARQFYNYTDIITNIRGGDLHVHHVITPYFDILVQVLQEFNIHGNQKINEFTDKERTQLYNRMLELHKESGYGLPLSKATHEEFHHLYGTKNNTPEQFIEYAKKYHNINLEIREDSEHRKYLARKED